MKATPRLLFVSLTLDGGTPQYAQNLANHIDLPMDIHVSAHCDDVFLKKEYYNVSVNKGAKNAIFFALTRLPLLVIKLFRELIQKKYDVLYVSGPLWLDLVYVLIFRLFGKRVYYTVHEGVGRSGAKHRSSIIWSVKLATHLIFLSEFQKDKVLKALKLRNKKTKVIYHTDLKDENLPLNCRTLPSKPNLALIGTIGPYKGFDTLVQALKEIDSALFNKVTVAGRFKVSIPDSLPHKLNIINRYLSVEELHALFLETDIIVLPYSEASQSGIAAQSIGYLIPTIITPVGALPEQFQGAAYITKDTSVGSLIEAINLACTDTRKYQDISNQLFKIRTNISWPNIGNNAKEFITEA